MEKIKIGNKTIGYGEKVFIIAEAGVNHNGNIEIAKKLIDAAIFAGVDAIKFQTFKSENIVIEKGEMAEYQKKNLGKEESQLKMLKRLELPYESFVALKKYCDQKGIIFLSTAHTFDAIDFLDKLVPAFKFGSGDLNNLPYLKYAAKKGKPIILGTGMSTFDEVYDAIKTIKSEGNNKIIVLHCTTNYPCPLEEVNMNAMVNMMKKLDCYVGYSDHTSGITVPVMATTLGAVVIEKHFTLDKNLSGPDHKASLEPHELKEMVNAIRNTELAMGKDIKEPTESEKVIMKMARKSIVASRDIQENTIITEDMVCIKRPGIGIEPKMLECIIGKTANINIKKDTLILKEHIKGSKI